MRQLRSEGRLIYGLSHPNIVRGHEVNTINDPPYVAMEYIEGVTLRQKLRAEGRLAADAAVEIMKQVLEALAYAHGRGVLHRDLKPENVMLAGGGAVKVTDFGLGRAQADVARSIVMSGSLLTAGGRSISGTLEYMSPQQKEGAEADERDDIYAAGVMLCEMLTGRRPDALGVGRMLQRAGVDGRFAEVLEKALEPERADRCGSAGEMLEMLRAAVGPPAAPKHAGPAGAGKKPAASAPGASAAGARFKQTTLPTGNDGLAVDIGGGMEMLFARIPAGEFLMGGELPAKEMVKRFGDMGSWCANEHPRHRVMLTRPFWLGVHEVTRGQFAQFIAETGYRTDAEKAGSGGAMTKKGGKKEAPGPNWRNPGIEQTDEHPVVQVSWNDAVAFCKWLSWETGKKCRLPTEAEWEYACRAGTQTIFPWGDDIEGGRRYANMCDKSYMKHNKCTSTDLWALAVPWDDGWPATSPVGFFEPNAWGLHDMIGNVWEPCADWYEPYVDAYQRHRKLFDRLGDWLSGRQWSVTDPTGPAKGQDRICRGGSWTCPPWFCRAAFRGCRWPDPQSNEIGFRLALDFP